jgi:hypothetical protein
VSRRSTSGVRASAADPAATMSAVANAKSRVQRLLASGHALYDPAPDMGDAIADLIGQHSGVLTPGEAVAQGMGSGTWQVSVLHYLGEGCVCVWGGTGLHARRLFDLRLVHWAALKST